MRGSHKFIIPFSLIFVLSVFFFTSAFAQIIVTDQANCDPFNVLFETYRGENSHASLDGGPYDKVFCYEEKFPNDAGVDTLTYPSGDSLRNCWAENVLLKATGSSNAHVAVPKQFLSNPDDYQQSICYGYLQCSTTQGSDSQLLAKLSGETNAHITKPTSSDANFATDVYCWEPICNQETYAEGTQFPNLYTFDSDKAHFELANLEDSSAITIATPPNPLSFEAASISLGGTRDNLRAQIRPLRIQNWDGYAFFEFFVYYTEEQNLRNVVISFETGAGNKIYNLWEYTTQTLVPNTWVKVRFPVESMAFNNPVSSITFSLGNSNHNANFYVDSMTFIPKSDSADQFDTFYCDQSSDGTVYSWITDADTSPTTCANINGFERVGLSCCGDDSGEYFAASERGCFDSLAIENGTVFKKVYDQGTSFSSQICVGENCEGSLIVVNETTNYLQGHNYGFEDGVFYACGDNSDAPDSLFVQAAYSLPGATGLVDGAACVTVGEYYCSPEGYFSNRVDDVEGGDYFESDDATVPSETQTVPFTNAGERTVLKQDMDGEGFSCCPTGYCNYDGRCIEDMSNEPWVEGIDIGNGEKNRCINGEWTLGVLKPNFDGSEFGYCPQTTDCFVTNRGDVDSCIESNTAYFDNYCYEGDWTSRTAVLAKTIVEFAVEGENIDKYSLYCDDFQKTLNYLGVVNNRKVEFLLRGAENQGFSSSANVCGPEGCVNNFCVLNPADESTVFFGTSLNGISVNNKTYGIGAVFNLSCDSAPNNDGVVSCAKQSGEDGQWFYYPGSDIVIFKEDERLFAGIVDSISDFFSSAIRLLPFVDDLDSDLPDAFDNVQLYNRAYILEGDDVKVQGFTENVFDSDVAVQDFVDALYIVYESQSATALEVCDIVESIKQTYGAVDAAKTTCVVETHNGKSVSIITSTSSQLEDIWSDLTAKLRET